jgi:hypothetical protein
VVNDAEDVTRDIANLYDETRLAGFEEATRPVLSPYHRVNRLP